MNKEIWKDVIGYEGLYQVSNLGRVKSLFRYKKILKRFEDNKGYLRVTLYKNNKSTLIIQIIVKYILQVVVEKCILISDNTKP